ncbi:DUF3726 domain-containing protein [Curvivirga aplysinae]|uniref:DUF3726 domain-containing protein n=1 Tax=Curvivirga aplysinae TaxID=2529852 RepID=UPI0012BC8A33|nr:DUF3726 domain-containing protein [Curvivirga aplysinae]MTI10387.1 DUF3726 domain-containing protein [Curvivirga aplysinae]
MTDTFGPVSLSELMFFTSRAAFGAGCSYGIAEDVATAAVWFAKQGIDPTGPLARALDTVFDSPSSTELQKSELEGQIKLSAKSGSVTSAIYAGVIASDQLALINGDKNRAIRIENVESPALVEAFIKALSPIGTLVKLSASEDINNPQTGDLTISTDQVVELNKSQTHTSLNDHHNILVSQSGWDGILKHFKNSLVEATEASRLSGAGAGLVDTD